MDSPARVLDYDYGYEKLIERGGKSVRAKSFWPSPWPSKPYHYFFLLPSNLIGLSLASGFYINSYCVPEYDVIIKISMPEPLA